MDFNSKAVFESLKSIIFFKFLKLKSILKLEINPLCKIKFYFCTMNQINAKNYSVNFEENGFNELDVIIKKKLYSSIFVLVDSNTNKECIPIFEKKISNPFDFKVIEIELQE